MLCKIFFANGGGSSALLFVLTRGCNFATKRRSKVSGLVCLLSLRGLVACLLKREWKQKREHKDDDEQGTEDEIFFLLHWSSF